MKGEYEEMKMKGLQEQKKDRTVKGEGESVCAQREGKESSQ